MKLRERLMVFSGAVTTCVLFFLASEVRVFNDGNAGGDASIAASGAAEYAYVPSHERIAAVGDGAEGGGRILRRAVTEKASAEATGRKSRLEPIPNSESDVGEVRDSGSVIQPLDPPRSGPKVMSRPEIAEVSESGIDDAKIDDFNDILFHIMHVPKLDISEGTPCDDNPTIAELVGIPIRDNLTAWERFHLSIRRCEMYKEEPIVRQLLHDMATQPIVHVSE